jgi:hypothetical protein
MDADTAGASESLSIAIRRWHIIRVFDRRRDRIAVALSVGP